jgi:hypothetical protein
MTTIGGKKEVKLKASHLENNKGMNGQPPMIEPITPEVVAQMEKKLPSTEVKVETTKARTQ